MVEGCEFLWKVGSCGERGSRGVSGVFFSSLGYLGGYHLMQAFCPFLLIRVASVITFIRTTND